MITACEALDRQYMLGGSLLVAPVFRKDGKVDYYLPKGSWTHLLSGETREGGQWHHETYGLDSLPLFVRENSILPAGPKRSAGRLRLSGRPGAAPVTPRQKAYPQRCHMVDSKGNPTLTVTMTKQNGSVTLTADGSHPAISVILHGDHTASGTLEPNQRKITLD